MAFSQYFSKFEQLSSSAAITDITPPTFSGISGLTVNSDGSLTASWSAGSDPSTPIRYEVYLQAATATNLFLTTNIQRVTYGTSARIFTDVAGNVLAIGTTYYVGVRAVDAVGNRETNTVSLNQTASGANFATLLNGVVAQIDVPNFIDLPTTGTKTYLLRIRLLNNIGINIDPDSNAATITLQDMAGGTILAAQSLTRISTGSYSYTYTVNATDPIQPILAVFSFTYNSVAYTRRQLTEVVNDEKQLAALVATVGTPTGASVSADIAALQTTENNVYARMGAPAGASMSADIAALQTTENNVYARLGAPAGGSMSADIASIKTDTTKVGNPANGTLAADLAQIEGQTVTLGNPVGSTFSADIANVQSTATNTYNRLGAPAGASTAADIASLKTDTTTLLSRLTAGRGANLDFLDVSVASRQSTATALTQYNQLNTNDAGILTAVQGIQNNTSFTATVPESVEIPVSGSLSVVMYARIFNDLNQPADPDSNTINISIKDSTGATVLASTAMTRTSTGIYTYTYSVLSTDVERLLYIFFGYSLSSVAIQQSRAMNVLEFQSDLQTLLNRLTPQRASNLDFLDVAISSREADSAALTRYTNVQAQQTVTQTAVAAVSTTIGVPVFGTVTADITTVRTQTDKIGSPAHTTLAGDMAALQTSENNTYARLGAPAGPSVSADIAAIEAQTALIGSPAHSTLAGDLSFIETTMGTPAGASLAADVASVKSDSSGLRTDYTTARATKIDNLDTNVGSRQSTATALTQYNQLNTNDGVLLSNLTTIETTLGTPATSSVSSDIAAVKGDTGGIRADYTTARAVKLDHLDVDVSSRQSTSTAAIQYNQLNTNELSIISAVSSIQNNTTFAPVVPTTISLPSSGSLTVRFYANLLDTSGHPTDPDSSLVDVTIKDIGGGVVVATTPMTRDGVGQYHYDYVVNSTDPQQALQVIFEYTQSSTAFQFVRSTSTSNDATNLGVLVSRLTEQRANNLDYLDISVASRSADVDMATLLTRLTPGRAANLDYLDAPVSLTALEVDVVTLLTRITAPRAANLDNLDVPVSTRATQGSADGLITYVNRMTTSRDNVTGIQEVLAWAEKNGVAVAGTLCTVSVKDDTGGTIWTASLATPGPDGVFSFSNAFTPLADGNFYIQITITVDGSPRTNLQPFVAIG
jgi:hypothetical protein